MVKQAILQLLIFVSFSYQIVELEPYETQLLQQNDQSIQINTRTSLKYNAKIELGSPPQVFTVSIDTGSPFLWVPDVNCRANCHNPRNKYNPLQSEMYAATDVQIAIEEWDSYYKGILAYEKFSMGNISATSIQFIQVDETQNLDQPGVDGGLGLGLQYIELNRNTFLDELKKANAINKRVFSIFINAYDISRSVAPHNEKSNIILGGYDLKYAIEQPTYIPVFTETGNWAVPFNGASINGNFIKDGSILAVFDTGSQFIRVPEKEYQKVVYEITKSGDCFSDMSGVMCDCGVMYQIDSYPEIHLYLGFGSEIANVKINPNDYFQDNFSTCKLLMESTQGLKHWIIGNTFFRGYYAIFDQENKRIGIAPSINYGTAIKANSGSAILLVLGALGLLGGVVYRYQVLQNKRNNPATHHLLQ